MKCMGLDREPSVRTDAFGLDAGCAGLQWLAQPENRKSADRFHKAMVSFSSVCVPAFLESYDSSQFHTLMDVGGGPGGIVRAILKSCPNLKAVIADLPEVVEHASKALRDDGL